MGKRSRPGYSFLGGFHSASLEARLTGGRRSFGGGQKGKEDCPEAGNRRASEGLQSGLLFLLDVEKFVQFGDLEHLVNLGVNVAQY